MASSSSTVPTILASFYEPPEWQNEVDDVPERERVAERLAELIASLYGEDEDLSFDDFQAMIFNLEVYLYTDAFSKEEFADEATLKRRLRVALQTSNNPFGPPSNDTAEFDLGAGVGAPSSKRQRVQQAEFLLNNDLGLVKHIYSFIDGMEIYHNHLSVNRFTASHLKGCIQNLEIPLSVLTAPDQPQNLLLTMLQNSPQLEVLKILDPDTSLPPEDPKTFKNVRLISELAKALNQGMVQNMKYLDLRLTLFPPNCDAAPEKNCTKALFEALSKGNHSGLVAIRLRDFVCWDTALKIATLIVEGKLPSLKVLDLAGNGIGEQGARALWVALTSRSTGLQLLGLAGNILTDRDAKRFTKALEESDTMESLQLIDLRGNLITQEGFQALQSVLKQERYAHIELMSA